MIDIETKGKRGNKDANNTGIFLSHERKFERGGASDGARVFYSIFFLK